MDPSQNTTTTNKNLFKPLLIKQICCINNVLTCLLITIVRLIVTRLPVFKYISVPRYLRPASYLGLISTYILTFIISCPGWNLNYLKISDLLCFQIYANPKIVSAK